MGTIEPFFIEDTKPVSFGKSFVHSEQFKILFHKGMTLVEETASYLDGEGRSVSRGLERHTALTYASESMRLTTRLMQIASWLLIQRAVSEGEITPDQALEEKNRVSLTVSEYHKPSDYDALPDALKDLIEQSRGLHTRILHLNQLTDEEHQPVTVESPVAIQQFLLQSAFQG